MNQKKEPTETAYDYSLFCGRLDTSLQLLGGDEDGPHLDWWIILNLECNFRESFSAFDSLYRSSLTLVRADSGVVPLELFHTNGRPLRHNQYRHPLFALPAISILEALIKDIEAATTYRSFLTGENVGWVSNDIEMLTRAATCLIALTSIPSSDSVHVVAYVTPLRSNPTRRDFDSITP